jgi:hypothetical protein
VQVVARGEVHHTHPTFAQWAHQSIGSKRLIGQSRRRRGQNGVGHGADIAIEHRVVGSIGAQQLFDFGTQRVIAVACRGQLVRLLL